MRVSRVTVRLGRTVQLAPYQSAKAEWEESWEVEDGDDPGKVRARALFSCRAGLRGAIEKAREISG
jgi:hypothetical protein